MLYRKKCNQLRIMIYNNNNLSSQNEERKNVKKIILI